jgi:hypothetical protein
MFSYAVFIAYGALFGLTEDELGAFIQGYRAKVLGEFDDEDDFDLWTDSCSFTRLLGGGGGGDFDASICFNSLFSTPSAVGVPAGPRYLTH